MNFAHLHLLLNHFPIIGTIIGLGLFLASLVGKNEDLNRAGLILLSVMALVTMPTFFSGIGAQGAIEADSSVSSFLIERHEGAAMLAMLFMEITGVLALMSLWQLHRGSNRRRWNLSAVLLFSALTVALMARVGTTGGEIRHPEIRSGQELTGVEPSAISRVVHAFEPSPTKFTSLMLFSKFWWAFMMDMHFIGLALLIGTMGLLDLRLLGFAKQLPIGVVHQLVPWALAGFGINVVTGILAFTGMPMYFTYNVAFWVKMLAIQLLGLNAAVFYLTGTFRRIERLGPGDDAPPLAKVIAGTSLILWFAVIALGRYIAWFSGSDILSP